MSMPDFSQMPEAARLALRETVLEGLYKSRTTHVAIYTALLWETLITLPLERRVIWKTKFTALTAVYLINRYWVVLSLAINIFYLEYQKSSYEQCDKIVRFTNGSSMVTFGAASLLMIIRTWSICDRKKHVLAILGLMLVANIVVQAIAVAKTTVNPMFPALDLDACLPMGVDAWFYAFFAGIVLLDVTSVAFAASKTFNAWKGCRSQLTVVLLRDTVFWLFATLCASLANLIYFSFAPHTSNRALLAVLSFTVQSISASRMVLAIRSAAALPGDSHNTMNRDDGQSRMPVTPTSPFGKHPATPAAPLTPVRLPNSAYMRDASSDNVADEKWQHGV